MSEIGIELTDQWGAEADNQILIFPAIQSMHEKNSLHDRFQTGILRIEVAALVMLLTALGLVLSTDLYSTLHKDQPTAAVSAPPNNEVAMANDAHMNEQLGLQPVASVEAQVN